MWKFPHFHIPKFSNCPDLVRITIPLDCEVAAVYPAIPQQVVVVQAIKAAGSPVRNAVRAAAELGVPMSRGLIPTLLFAFSAIVFFGLGNLFAARQAATTDTDQIAALRAEVGALKRQRTGIAGTSGRTADAAAVAPMDD